MGYRIKRREEPGEAAARIAGEQTTAALASLHDTEALGMAGSILDGRKRCRKLRGLVRLIPPDRTKQARRLDRLYRDAARELAGTREAHASLATFERLMAATGSADPGEARPDPAHLDAVRSELARRSVEASEVLADVTEPLERAAALLTEASERIDNWIVGRGWDAIATGLEVTYRAGAGHLAALQDDPTADGGHDLRKQAKYTWYHLRLLERAAPSMLVPLAGAFENLVEGLGDANDLAVLRQLIAREPDAFGGAEAAGPVVDFLDDHHRQLHLRAVSSAGRLYAERPAAFARRLGTYWELWHSAGPELAIGPLTPPIPELRSEQELQPELPPEPVDMLDDSGPEVDDGLDRRTVADLRRLARDAGLGGHSKSRRDVLLAELRANGITAIER